MSNYLLSGAQIRAARALLRWSVEELASRAVLGLNTIKRAEAKEGRTSLTAANELAIRRAFEAAGVEFTNGDLPGLRLTRTAAARTDESAESSKMTTKMGRRNTTEATTKKR